MKTIKSIDGKSLLIGGLLACTIFFAMGATSTTDKWDDEQQWTIFFTDTNSLLDGGKAYTKGAEPFAYIPQNGRNPVLMRKRTK